MSRAFAAIAVLMMAGSARADCARAHAECDAQRGACNQNRRPVRGSQDPNAACAQMAQAKCAAASNCDATERTELRRERHQEREQRREQSEAAAYQQGLEAGRAAADSAKPSAPPAVSDHADWRPEDEDDSPPPPQNAPSATPSAPLNAPPKIALPLSNSEIDEVVHQTQDNLHVCLQENLGPEVPRLQVTLRFVIDAQGQANKLTTAGLENLPAQKDIGECFARVSGMWHFRNPPAAQPAQASVSF
jgi:hypothetical protein